MNEDDKRKAPVGWIILTKHRLADEHGGSKFTVRVSDVRIAGEREGNRAYITLTTGETIAVNESFDEVITAINEVIAYYSRV